MDKKVTELETELEYEMVQNKQVVVPSRRSSPRRPRPSNLGTQAQLLSALVCKQSYKRLLRDADDVHQRELAETRHNVENEKTETRRLRAKLDLMRAKAIFK